MNTGIVACAVALEQSQSVFLTWRTHFVHLGLAYTAGGYTALLLALFAPSSGVLAFLMLAPMPLVLYASVRMWLGRINDRVTHLDTINRQYRATIEALAHAIDAKDQVTHGHIRRVQSASLRLARALGCTDEGQLHAIEAASLLHDLGKLAIPEHILNKPGRLSEAEYTTMKDHARIGAEILAGVDFPYPSCRSFATIMKTGMAPAIPTVSRAIRSPSGLESCPSSIVSTHSPPIDRIDARSRAARRSPFCRSGAPCRTSECVDLFVTMVPAIEPERCYGAAAASSVTVDPSDPRERGVGATLRRRALRGARRPGAGGGLSCATAARPG